MAQLRFNDAATPSLLGFGAGEPPSALEQEISGFLLRAQNPDSTEVAEFLKLYVPGQRDAVARALVAHGVSANAVSSALNFLNASSGWNARKIGGVLAVISAMASGFHGYRRNQSIGYGALWFVLGGIFPIFTPVVALAQGFGQRKAS